LERKVHPWDQPLDVGGYVLAGGKSSRMGRDKALLPLAGKPLVEHAVIKLRRLCRSVAILSNNEELAQFAPVVNDLHPDCGPMSGIEAALAHSAYEWSMILPVDVPFPPSALLRGWMESVLRWERRGARLALFTTEGIPQPTLLMIHREVAPYLSVALAQQNYKLFPVLRHAAEDLAGKHAQARPHEALSPLMGGTMVQMAWQRGATFKTSGSSFPSGPAWQFSTPAQEAATHLYFANLNTPEDFAEAEKHADVLDT